MFTGYAFGYTSYEYYHTARLLETNLRLNVKERGVRLKKCSKTLGLDHQNQPKSRPDEYQNYYRLFNDTAFVMR